MKTIYFVRHGESETNVGPILLGPAAMLTEKGKQQAAFIAERAAKLDFEVIISSTYQRAKDTAQAIVDKTSKPIEYSDLFIERRQATSIMGKRNDDPHYLGYLKQLREHGHEPQWRFEDAENFGDLKIRAAAALQYLEGRAEENIIVVTHGLFMRVLVARVIMGEDLSGHEYSQFVQSMEMQNTGLSVLRHGRTGSWKPWELWIWNDHSHLGDS